jgi:hypothetical protein
MANVEVPETMLETKAENSQSGYASLEITISAREQTTITAIATQCPKNVFMNIWFLLFSLKDDISSHSQAVVGAIISSDKIIQHAEKGRTSLWGWENSPIEYSEIACAKAKIHQRGKRLVDISDSRKI